MGMKMGGMKTCGDYMFSGHTITITTATLIAIECKLHHLKKIDFCLFNVRHNVLNAFKVNFTELRFIDYFT